MDMNDSDCLFHNGLSHVKNVCLVTNSEPNYGTTPKPCNVKKCFESTFSFRTVEQSLSLTASYKVDMIPR